MSIIYLLASFGAINGLLIGVFLIFKNQNKVANAYLGGLLVALSLRIGKSVIFIFGENVDRLILQIGLSACIFIGPFFYLYTKALRTQVKKFGSGDKALLMVIFLLIVSIGITFPYRDRPEIWNGYVVYGIYSIWGLFTLLGLYEAFKQLKSVLLQPRKMTRTQQHLTVVVIAVLFINLTYQMALFVGFTYIWGSLIFSLALYFLIGRALLSSKILSPKSADQPLENAPQLLSDLNAIMESKKPYLNPQLKLDDLAELAQLPKHTLSKLLNGEYTFGFAQYVKEYRVKEAKALINVRPELKLEGIGYEAGFSSKSTFFDAFKKLTNQTPLEYQKAQNTGADPTN